MAVLKATVRHPGTRPLAWLTILSLLALTFGAAPQRASAQEQRARSVAILDFASDSGGDAILGRAASAALHLKMAERQYNVRARSEVREAFVRLGLREPLEPDEVRRLYQDLDTELIVGGRVLKVDQGDTPRPWARVLLRVEVYDGASGDLTNGAIAEGYETGRGSSQTDREATLNDAVERAATKALEVIESNTLIEGKVMLYSPVDNPPTVVINRGMKYGVQDGMLFDIFRVDLDPSDASRTRQFKVGRIKVTSVSSDEAEGTVLETNGGIRTNDILRQVFSFPAIEEAVPVRDTRGNVVQGPRQAKRGGSSGMLAGLLGTVAGLAGLALLLTMSNNQSTSAPRVNARTGAYLQQATPGTFPSVVVEWGDRDFSPPRNFIGGYIVYRAQSQNFAAVPSEAIGAVPGSGQRNFSDDPAWLDINTTIPVRFTMQEGTETIDVREDIDIRIVHQSVQPGQTYFYKVRRLGPASVIIPPTLIDTSGTNSGGGGGGGGGFGGGGGGFGGGGGGFGGFRSRQAALPRLKRGEMLLQSGGNIFVRRRPGTVIGRHRQVASIPPGPQYDTTLDPTVDNDIGTSEDIALSNASGAVGPVTYIASPDPRAPSDNNQAQRVDDIAFQWQGQFGATDYVVQISRNVNFTPLVFESPPQVNTSASLLNFRYNNTQSGFVELSPNTTYFWRVGARCTQGNQAAPKPFGFVFSRVSTFSTADQPPVAP